MFRRENLQPDPMKEYTIITATDNLYRARWLVSNTFEGWYLPEIRQIFKQKDLRVKAYCEDNKPVKQYFPKGMLDDIFKGRDEVPRFPLINRIDEEKKYG